MSDQPEQSHQRLRPSGGYRDLRSFRTAGIVYDATVAFCARFVDPRSRLVDQMVQAARSGRQNIAEGSRASAVSSQTELRLVSVARASLDELLLDYEDFLRQRKLSQWKKDSPEAIKVRAVGKSDRTDRSDRTDPSDAYSAWLQSPDPAIVANAVICLIHQTNYLLDRQITALERDFISGGGYSERLAAERIAERTRKKNRADQPDPADPSNLIAPCPQCGKPMVLRTARKGGNAGAQFWGCSAYPACKCVRNLDGAPAPHKEN
jgi:four helix bundle suffix protein